jgi:hypothetical protein
VYLHLDNNAYVVGDSIWYKAYVVRNSTHKATDVSRVLYVELLDESGRMMHRQTLKIDDEGGCDGCLPLQLPVRDGYYEVRAYTRAMLNWDEDAYFSRVIPIFSVENGQFKIAKVDKEWKLAHNAKRVFDFGNRDKHRLSFYPEGGHRVSGHMQRIAYALTDGEGCYSADTLRVYDENDQIIAVSAPLHEGRGTFVLPSTNGDVYAMVGKERFDLPNALPTGYSMRADMSEDFIDIRVERSSEVAPTAIGLAIFNRENVCYFDTLRMDQNVVEFSLPMCCLHHGINRLELFDVAGRSLACRMVYRTLKDEGLQIYVSQSQSAYASYAPIKLEVQVKDKTNVLENANLSISVRDLNNELIHGDFGGIDVEMLLSSEIRGYVHNPEFYFNTMKNSVDSSFRVEALDHLLLVQGWRAVDFEKMSNYVSFDVPHIAEEGLMLRGRVYKDNDKAKPLSESLLKIRMHNALGQAVKGEAMLDSIGYFSFLSEEDYIGEMIAHLSVENEKGKNVWARVTFDRWFSPEVRRMWPMEMDYEKPKVLPLLQDSMRQRTIEFFMDLDSLEVEGDVQLSTAEVVGKRKSKLNGNRYLWDGGLMKGLKYSDEYYDVVRELERWRDQGNEGTMNVVSFVSWLVDSTEYWAANLDDFVAMFEEEPINEFELSSEDIKKPNIFMNVLDGKQTAWALNNNLLKRHEGVDLLAEQIQSFVVIDDPNMINKFTMVAKMKYIANVDLEFFVNAVSGVDKAEHRIDQLIVLYERPNSYLYRSNKKDMKRTVWGYEPKVNFYNPNYSECLLPEQPDMRRTLYWNPQLKLNEEGKATAVFFNNCHDSTQLRISIQGVTSDGRLVSFER